MAAQPRDVVAMPIDLTHRLVIFESWTSDHKIRNALIVLT